MLLPSSIQRAEDLVGIAMPTVPLLWAIAAPDSARAPRPANAAAMMVLKFSMLHSLWIFEFHQ